MSRVRKQSDGMPQKIGPMKATLPMPSLLSSLRGPSQSRTTRSSFSLALSPPMRHVSPEHSVAGHRSPGAMCSRGKSLSPSESIGMRRTASLDALYMRPSWNFAATCSRLHLDKATQTEETLLCVTAAVLSEIELLGGSPVRLESTMADHKIEKVIRQRMTGRVQRSDNLSVSSQTLSCSPAHAKASPVSIPARPCAPIHLRPMRNSVEGLNQEIEKLVLFPGQPHTCRSETSMVNFSRCTPEGHRAPLADILHGDMRSVNTQTPIGDNLSSDESQSTSPEDNASNTRASPRINRFLAREPPDGCEKVNLKANEIIGHTTNTRLYKPCVGFQLRPSLGSAFQPLQPIPMQATPEKCDDHLDVEVHDIVDNVVNCLPVEQLAAPKTFVINTSTSTSTTTPTSADDLG